MGKAILVVDVQNDFVEGGSLACQGGLAAADKIDQWLKNHDYDLVISSQDWHKADDDNGGHIAKEPDYVDSWPVHCVAESEGADYAKPLTSDRFDVRLKKGYGFPAYSAFEGKTDDGGTLESILKEKGISSLDIVGIATDHCVLQSGLDAIKAGFNIEIYPDMCAAVNACRGQVALADLQTLGAIIH